MSRKGRIAAAICVVGAITTTIAPSAEAAAPEEFTITEDLNFDTGIFEFETTGPLCESGTFADEPRVLAGGRNGRINIVIDTIYTCDDGAGHSSLKSTCTSCSMRTPRPAPDRFSCRAAPGTTPV